MQNETPVTEPRLGKMRLIFVRKVGKSALESGKRNSIMSATNKSGTLSPERSAMIALPSRGRSVRHPPLWQSRALALNGPCRRGDLHLVQARRRHGEDQQAVDPDHAAPARGKREGMEQAARTDGVRFTSLADLTRPNVGVESRVWPGQQASRRTRAVVLCRATCPLSGVSWHSCRMRDLNSPPQAHTAGPLHPALGGKASRSE